MAQKLAELRVQTARGIPAAAVRWTVRSYGDHWLEHVVKPSPKPSTASSYEWLLVRGPRVDGQEVRPWSALEANLFLSACRDHRLSALFTVGVALGLRKGELLALRWVDVDFDQGTLRVVQTVQRLGRGLGLVTGEPETKRSRRTVPMPAVCTAELRRHRAGQGVERLQAGDDWRNLGLVFASTRGDGHGTSQLEPVVRRPHPGVPDFDASGSMTSGTRARRCSWRRACNREWLWRCWGTLNWRWQRTSTATSCRPR